MKTAEALWDAQVAWKRRVEDYAVEHLLSLKNDNWLDEDEEPLSADQFKSRITLESITISPGGRFRFWHDDGDLFAGHSIEVSGSLQAGLTDADIPG